VKDPTTTKAHAKPGAGFETQLKVALEVMRRETKSLKRRRNTRSISPIKRFPQLE
jgi:hypothetical protein